MGGGGEAPTLNPAARVVQTCVANSPCPMRTPPLCSRWLKSTKPKGEDGRRLNKIGGKKHRKTYSLEYKAKCVAMYEAAVAAQTPSPQVVVSRQEGVDCSMLGRWIRLKGKIELSVAASGKKKCITKNKLKQHLAAMGTGQSADLSVLHDPNGPAEAGMAISAVAGTIAPPVQHLSDDVHMSSAGMIQHGISV